MSVLMWKIDMNIRASWYNGEAWRVFPNIEITFGDDRMYISFVWCKFIIEFEV